MRLRSVLSMAIMGVMIPCHAGQRVEPVLDLLLQHEVRLEGEDPQRTDLPPTLIADLRGLEKPNADYLLMLVKNKFEQAGIETKMYAGDFSSDFENRRLGAKTLLAKRIVVEVASPQSARDEGLSYRASLALVDYNPVGPGVYRAKRVWWAQQDVRGLSRAELDDALSRYLQAEAGNLVRSQFRGHVKRTVRKKAPGGATSGTSSGNSLSYRLSWNDPDNRRNRFTFGASFGTPALGNVHFGFWGSRAFPIVTSISGMYYGLDRRGLQAEVGWAFDNEGSFKEAVTLNFIMFNGTEETTKEEKDIFGRVTRATTETWNELHPYVGPSYVVDWRDFRAQAGVALRVDGATNQSSVRALFQIGYTPRLGF